MKFFKMKNKGQNFFFLQGNKPGYKSLVVTSEGQNIYQFP